MSGASWQAWDGRKLCWQLDATTCTSTHVYLYLDGVVFARLPTAPTGEVAFALAPAGHAQMEFSLRNADGEPVLPAWRVLYETAATPSVDQWLGVIAPMQTLIDAALPAMPNNGASRRVSIVVPIYNRAPIVRRCIESVLRWSGGNARLILIDDASQDTDVATLLAEFAQRAGIRVLRNPQNLGYTRTCNIGIETAEDDDIVLLNADTQVGPRWLARLQHIAMAHADIGTVTAVSDNAGAFSVPELEQFCPIPANWSLQQTQRALLQNAGGCLPQLPTGNGFCMYIKRAMLDRVGVLDADAFPSGYGEENDLCQRGEQAGFRHVIAGDVFVQHVRSASFGEARRHALGAAGMKVLRQRYPDYEEKVGAMLYSFARRVLDYRVRRVYAQASNHPATAAPRPRVLIVADSIDCAHACATAVTDEYECFIAHAHPAGWRLLRRVQSGLTQIVHSNATLELPDLLRMCLPRYAIELLHTFIPSSVSLRAVASSLQVPLLDSSADGDLLRLCQQPSTSPDLENSRNLSAACAHRYRACWHSAAIF